MKFFKNVLADLFGQKKANKYRLRADISKCSSSPVFQEQFGKETRKMVGEKSLDSFKMK